MFQDPFPVYFAGSGGFKLMKKKCNNVRYRSERLQAAMSRMAQSRAYCGLKSIAGEAGESVMVTVIRLRPGGVSL
jgi:hypothetical protein